MNIEHLYHLGQYVQMMW